MDMSEPVVIRSKMKELRPLKESYLGRDTNRIPTGVEGREGLR
jgi:hypothetical protein